MPEIAKIKQLLTEDQKYAPNVPVYDLAYDFSCRITRLYKFLNQKHLSKADRDIIYTFGMQLLRSASSISANLNEARHPQSDADYLSKTNISLKEARESEHWINLLFDNEYITYIQFASLKHDLDRILSILVTIVNKVSSRLRAEKKK